MVLEGDAGKLNKQQEELLKQSFMSSQRMVNLIADLLNLSRVTRDQMRLEKVDLTALAHAVADQLRESSNP